MPVNPTHFISSRPLHLLSVVFAIAAGACSDGPVPPGQAPGVDAARVDPDAGATAGGADAAPEPEDAAAEDAGPADAEASDRGAPDAGTVTDLTRMLAEAECARDVRCVPGTLDGFGMDESQCVVAAMAEIAPAIAALAEGIGEGRLAFDGDVARQCADEIRSSDCTLGPDRTVCRRMFQGARGEGRGCFVDAECAPGTYCQDPPAAAGCTYSPLFLELSTLICMNRSNSCGVCTRYAATGGPCFSNRNCDEAVASCRNVGTAASPNFMCVPKVSTGEPCGGARGVCQHFLECVGSPGAETCQRSARLGEACDDRQVSAPRCFGPEGLRCGAADVCVRAAPIARIGEACSGAVSCQLGARCDGATRRCVAYPGPGEACFEGGCRGAICQAGRCVALGQEGEACTAWGECASALGCRGARGAQAMCEPPRWSMCAP